METSATQQNEAYVPTFIAEVGFDGFQPRYVEYCKAMGFISPAHQQSHDTIAYGHRNVGFMLWARRRNPPARW